MADAKFQDAFDFYPNAAGALAKAVAFRSIAIQAVDSNERIVGAVCAYYSLLHLAISLMYVLPDKIEPKIADKLRAKRGRGEKDPSRLISHADAIGFVRKCCEEGGLDKVFVEEIDDAKELREFVNYRPEITIHDGQAYFGPCDRDLQPDSVDKLVAKLDGIFRSVLGWAQTKAAAKGTFLKDALSLSPSLFQREEPFYDRWCSRASVDSAMSFLNELDSMLKTVG